MCDSVGFSAAQRLCPPCSTTGLIKPSKGLSALLLAVLKLFTFDHLGSTEDILAVRAELPGLLACFKPCCHMLLCIIQAAKAA